MANPLWPAPLPQFPLVGSLTTKDQDAALRFQPDVGDQITRNRYTAKARSYAFGMIMTADQVKALDIFFATTLANGSLKFDWIDPVTRKANTFFFAAPYQVQALSAPGYFQVSLNLMRKAQ